MEQKNKQIQELSNSLLSRYKKNAGASASAADASGNLQKGNKRFSGIMKATRKQFSNDAKKSVAEGFSKLTPQQKAHEYNLDSAQREMDRRHNQGEDMTGAKIDKKTYKIVKPKKQGVAEAKDPREYDYEGDMAKSQLRSIIANAQSVHDMLEDTTNIAEWVQSKITLSADYISTVADYMQSEVNEAVTVKKEKYSWGKMMTVHHGSDTSYPLHPEHQQAIAKLGDGEKTSFKDETNSSVHAEREGDTVHLTRPRTSSTKTSVAHSHFNEELEQGVAEASNNTLKSYLQKVSSDSMKHKADPTKRSPEKASRSVAGFAKAQNRLEKNVNEEWTKTGKTGTHIASGEKTFEWAKVDSEGNETGERHYRNASGKVMGEEVEAEGSLNELSKDTLKSYGKKAVADGQASQKRSQIEIGKAASTKDDETAKTHYDAAKQAKDRTEKRMAGISGAIKRLTKQGVAEENIVETKGAPKGFHFTKSGKLKRGDADQDGNGGPMLRTDPLDKQRNKVPAVSERADHTFKSFRNQIAEKHLSTAEMKKREEVAQAMEREQPGMPMGKKMAIATATAKKAA